MANKVAEKDVPPNTFPQAKKCGLKYSSATSSKEKGNKTTNQVAANITKDKENVHPSPH